MDNDVTQIARLVQVYGEKWVHDEARRLGGRKRGRPKGSFTIPEAVDRRVLRVWARSDQPPIGGPT
jgi:hypothetical protein